MEATERSNRLDSPVTGRDGHALGDAGEEITLVEYGSFNCPSCLAANEVIANLRDHFGGRMAYVFRHRPLTGNDDARRAAELAEYAHQTTDQYWQAHHALMTRGPILRPGDFEAVAEELRLPPRDGQHENAWRRAQAKVQQDIDSAWRSGARVSPTFFINNRRYEGAWDESTLAEAMLGSLGHRMQTAALDFARWAPSTGLLLMINAGLAWAATILHGHERLIFAILTGLVIGKPAGMILVSALAVRLGLAVKPAEYSWRQMCGAGRSPALVSPCRCTSPTRRFPTSRISPLRRSEFFLPP
jgi:hypothetical protein